MQKENIFHVVSFNQKDWILFVRRRWESVEYPLCTTNGSRHCRENLTPSPKVSLHTQHLLHLHPHSVSRLKEKDFTCFVENFPTFPRQFQTLSHHPIVLECENEMRKCSFFFSFVTMRKLKLNP